MTFGSVQSQREAVPLGPAVASHCEPRLCSALRHPTLTPATTTTTTTTTSLSIIVHDKARHNQKNTISQTVRVDIMCWDGDMESPSRNGRDNWSARERIVRLPYHCQERRTGKLQLSSLG